MHLNSCSFGKLGDLLDVAVAGRRRAVGMEPEGFRLPSLLAKLSVALFGT